ncbi:hypothetical protein [Nocardia brasiliensis]|uniref:hypothetical protein n=1 Tax=Nocardia brasiliensis TaxID=37326 RepID=UPI003D946089
MTMAYLHSQVLANEGQGSLSLDWHDIRAAVRLLGDASAHYDIEIAWRPGVAGVQAWLKVEEARTLAEGLLAAINAYSETVDNGVDDTASVNGDENEAVSTEAVSSHTQQLFDNILTPDQPVPGSKGGAR